MNRHGESITNGNEKLAARLHLSAPAVQYDALKKNRKLPRQFFLRFESGCDMSCIFCVTKPRPSRYLDLDNVARFLAAASEFPLKEIVIVADEPLLHPGISMIVELCRAAGFSGIHLTTSGLLLDEPLARRLFQAGLTSVAVPLYSSDPVVHDGMAGISGAHETVLRNLEQVEKRNELKVFIHCLALKMNAPGLRTLRDEVAGRLGFPFVVLPLRPKNLACGSMSAPYRDIAPGYRELRKSLKGIPTAGFPLCVTPGASGSMDHFQKNVAPSLWMYLIMQGYSKPAVCGGCMKSKSCFGTFDEHLKIYGEDELKPFLAALKP